MKECKRRGERKIEREKADNVKGGRRDRKGNG